MQEGQCLCTRKSPLVLLLTISCAHTPSQHAQAIPDGPPSHHPTTPPKCVCQEDDSRVPLAGAVVVSSRETSGLRKLLQVGREPPPPCRRRGSVP
uniref:Secreted protein n=1 Tax=Cercocebus atys TaxID=9531 RepID=A0A2K5LRQ9_CERAT